jgi:glycosyltransferase involved in cell wall biosynthesis
VGPPSRLQGLSESAVRVCVLGVHSFEGRGPKVGTQHIAETLAEQGHEVVYVTAHASWAALFFREHRARYLATYRPVRLGERLLQVTPVNFMPMRMLKWLERTPFERGAVRLNAAVERTRGRLVEATEFDLCIFSAATTMTMLPKIRARRYIYRLNDLLGGFEALPRSLLEFERQVLETHPIAEVCAVNEELAARVRASHPYLQVRVVPNGVDLPLFQRAEPDPELLETKSRNVIYVGAFHPWTDVDLICATAELLPDHVFHLYGNWYGPLPSDRPANLRIHGPIRHRDVAAKMKGCSVGLIPSGRQNEGRMVTKPLKFYEYLAAGLGIVATSYGGKGLEPFALIGDTPEALAKAVVQAKSLPERFASEIREALRNRGWDYLVHQMLNGWAIDR